MLTATIQQTERWSTVRAVSSDSTSFLCCCKLHHLPLNYFQYCLIKDFLLSLMLMCIFFITCIVVLLRSMVTLAPGSFSL